MLEKMTIAQLAELVDLLESLNKPPHPLMNQLIEALSGKEKGGIETLKVAEACYAAYPRKVARAFAIKAFCKALKTVDAPFLLAAVRRFAVQCRGKEPQYVPHAATWVNQERFLDGIEELGGDEPLEPNEAAARRLCE